MILEGRPCIRETNQRDFLHFHPLIYLYCIYVVKALLLSARRSDRFLDPDKEEFILCSLGICILKGSDV